MMILLDDSPTKSMCQPYNHLCIHKYTHAWHNANLAALQHAQEATTSHVALSSLSLLLLSPSPPLQDGNKMRKRKHKREKEQRPLLLPSVPLAIANANNIHNAQAACATSPTPTLNEMLLAMIGILHMVQL